MCDHTNSATQICLCDIVNILSVNQDAAVTLLQVVEPIKKVEGDQLLRTGFPDEGYGYSLQDMERSTT
jgi:hypothetical protein